MSGTQAIFLLKLFGPPELTCEGEPVRLHRRKAMALLSFLTVTRSSHQREALATMLYPELDSKRAHAALRNLLWMIRRTPIGECLYSDRSVVQVAEGSILRSDVNQFRALTRECSTHHHGLDRACPQCVPLLTRAVDLVCGSFMQGFVAAGSVQFDDWQLAEGESLKRELEETLRLLTEYSQSAGDWASSERFARRWLGLNALSESGYRSLIRALAAQGKEYEATKESSNCERVLRREIGLPLEDETLELAEAIASHQLLEPGVIVQKKSIPRLGFPLVGRRDIADRIRQELLSGRSQVASIIGLGGIGKTSLALHLGRRIEREFKDGVVFVPMDSRPDELSLVNAVLDELGVPQSGNDLVSAEQRLSVLVRKRRLLLILDGIEERIPEARRLISALESAPDVRVLVTSRMELGISGEHRVHLAGLAYPAEGTPIGELADYPSLIMLQLAAERKGRHNVLGESDLSGMARVARVLEGSPLGLEMAASWCSVLTWDDIADRVGENLEFLVHRDQDVVSRHRAMVAIFEQSWELLPGSSRMALARLSIFRGGFTIQSAEYVADTDPGTLAGLVNCCLLVRVGADRYDMHELLRQFAAKKLSADADDDERTHQRHLEYYERFTWTCLERLRGSERLDALRQVDHEAWNVEIAFQYAARRGMDQQLRKMCESVLLVYDVRTLLAEGARTFVAAHDSYVKRDNCDPMIVTFLRLACAYNLHWSRPDLALSWKQKAQLTHRRGAPKERLHALANALYADVSRGEERQANGRRLEGSIAFYKAQEDPWGEVNALLSWAKTEYYHDVNHAEALAQRALRLCRETDDDWGESYAVHFLGRTAELRCEYELALARYQEAMKLYRPFGRDVFGVISSTIAQARVSVLLGHYQQGEQLATEAVHQSQECGLSFQEGRALIELARSRRGLGDRSAACKHLEEAFSLLNFKRWNQLQLDCALLLAEIAIEVNDRGQAKRWLQEAELLAPESPACASLRQALDEVNA